MTLLLGLLCVVGSALSASSAFAASSDLSFPVYGLDDRVEVYAESNALRRELALSTAAMMPSAVLSTTDHDTTLIKSQKYEDEFGLCADPKYGERFIGQQTAADCSAFLVSPNLVATAGHCVFTTEECQASRFVFGFMYATSDANPYEIPNRDVYTCKRVVRSQKPTDSAATPDFAIIELDRPVVDRQPLKIRESGSVSAGDPLFVIGYPSGLPAKIAGGANVRRLHDGVFAANLDTYGGNSGSAVFNAKTNEVEGILVEGEEDFTTIQLDSKLTCRVSLKCEDAGCIGEDSTPISNLLPFLRH